MQVGRRSVLGSIVAAFARVVLPRGNLPCDIVTIDGSGEHDCSRPVRWRYATVKTGPVQFFCERHAKNCATLPLVPV